MNIYFLIAALTSCGTCLLHIFLGGKFAAKPLLHNQDLNQVAKYTNYYCWHLVTITIAAMALAFAMAAQPGGSKDLALFATLLSALFCLLNLIMIFSFKLNKKHFPQWLLFLPGAFFGTLGLMN